MLLMEDIPMALDVSLPEVDESLFDLDSATAPSLAHKVPIPPRNRSNKILVDLAILHNEAYDLQQKLEELKQNRQAIMTSSKSGKWAQVARSQLAWKLRSMRENDDLNTMLKQQTAWRHQLEHWVLKKPRSIMNRLDDEQWRVLHLPLDDAMRNAAMHAILNRQFDRVESEMVASGLFDPSTDEVDSFRCNLTSPPQLVAEVMRFTTLTSPSTSSANVATNVWSTILSLGSRPDTTQLAYKWQLETIDDCTLYLRQWVGTLDGDFQLESGVLVKKFVADEKTCIVWRTVLEDAKMPFSPSSVVANHSGWIQIAPFDCAVSFTAYCKVQVADAGLASRLGPLLDAMRGGDGGQVASMNNAFAMMQDAFLCGFRVFEVDATAQDPDLETNAHDQGVAGGPGRIPPVQPWTWDGMAVEAPTLSTPSYSILCEA
ncbi:hypothetical protein H310_07530 [Aphanomyces invadans]|uniref:Uncharacterized protein n=1 Tax=Aphanomyces invadans TaxID=157072 RepID=A0A024U1I1_9STRA|nr:hypothetical protein H310_07530 [Aphanomyces invadans]ETW00114.1 hypothetical protein H310_07530 [Aphanomyces invadans]|eukprot:XP_008871139.1 hypothetical protein H310_07530 [Aphanomyces invadans]